MSEHPIHEAIHERIAHGFAHKYGLRAGLTYADAMTLERDLATYLRAWAAELASARGTIETIAQWDPVAVEWLERNHP